MNKFTTSFEYHLHTGQAIYEMKLDRLRRAIWVRQVSSTLHYLNIWLEIRNIYGRIGHPRIEPNATGFIYAGQRARGLTWSSLPIVTKNASVVVYGRDNGEDYIFCRQLCMMLAQAQDLGINR